MSKLTRLTGVLVVALAATAGATPAWSQSAEADLARASGGPQFIPDEVLVKFRPGTSAADKANARGLANATVVEVVTTPLMKSQGTGDLELVRLPPGLTVARAMGRLKGSFVVEYAEPNWVYYHDATSNDPYVTSNQLWGMTGTFGSQASTAWSNNKTGSSSVYVGIIDEGYMYTHEDLATNAGKNLGEIAGNGVDDDGNGYVDDVYGWDFDGNDNSTFDGTQDDHGTHVAGTIGAVGGNAKGVAGVVWNVKLLSGKFLGRRGGTTANAIKAVDYFTDLKTRRGLNVVATNNSWGGGGFSQALQDAIERANKANILFIAAAGNDGTNNETAPHYPSSYPNANIIAVASITSSGALSSFSNYGATSVDIGAPGSNITSTLPGRNGASTYGAYSGTSMATPHVSGGVALYASTHPGASAADIKAAVLNAAIATASLNGKTVTGGRLNVSGF